VRGRVHDEPVARSSRGLDLLDRRDELVPGPELVGGRRVGHAGLVEQGLVDVQAHGGEVGEERRDLAVLVLDEEVLHDAVLARDGAEVLELVHPDRVDGGDPREVGQAVGLGGVAQAGVEVVVRDVVDVDRHPGLLEVLVGHLLEAAALVRVAREPELDGLRVSLVAAADEAAGAEGQGRRTGGAGGEDESSLH
jgi:hypothetical protein